MAHAPPMVLGDTTTKVLTYRLYDTEYWGAGCLSFFFYPMSLRRLLSPDGDEIAGKAVLAHVVLVLDDEKCGAGPPAQSDCQGKQTCSWLDAVDIAW